MGHLERSLLGHEKTLRGSFPLSIAVPPKENFMFLAIRPILRACDAPLVQ